MLHDVLYSTQNKISMSMPHMRIWMGGGGGSGIQGGGLKGGPGPSDRKKL